MKNAVLNVCRVLCFVWLPFAVFGQGEDKPAPVVIEGRTMGTTYRIVYFDESRKDYTKAVDSLLGVINKAISTYDPDSEIARFNKSRRGIRLKLPYLYEILGVARRVHDASGGAFDPTVMPLVNAWGFGPEKSGTPNAAQVDSIRAFVGFDMVRFSRKKVRKTNRNVQLDMGGIGQGYGADVITQFLKSKGIRHMLVELGGEGMACGINVRKNHDWTIGILDPNSTPENQFFKAYVTLRDQAFTTSGNYFNYKIIDGRKFGHTIDPVSGYPVQHSLLSASVFAPDCTTADAWATAFMVMGTEKAIATLESLDHVDALLLYTDADGELRAYVTPGIEKQVTLE